MGRTYVLGLLALDRPLAAFGADAQLGSAGAQASAGIVCRHNPSERNCPMRYLILCLLLLCSCASTAPKSSSIFGPRAEAERRAAAIRPPAPAPTQSAASDTVTAREVLLADLARQSEYTRNAVVTLGMTALVAGGLGWSNANGRETEAKYKAPWIALAVGGALTIGLTAW